MSNSLLVSLLSIYGFFLIVCGITAVVFIGSRAKTALISGGSSGCVALASAYMLSIGLEAGKWTGLGLTAALFVVFSWRTTKTLFAVFDMVANNDSALKGKGVAFLIIALMAIVTLFVLFVQLVFLLS
jgi:hypothetical protein